MGLLLSPHTALPASPWVQRRGRTLGGLAVAVVVLLELGASSLHAINLDLTTRTPMTAYATPTTDWLGSHTGLSIALTDDDLGNPPYLIPGLRPNANALLGIRSIDGYDGGVQVTSAWLAAVGRAVGSADDELTLRSQIGGPLTPRAAASLAIRWAQIDLRRDAAAQLPGWLGPVASDDRFAVYENPLWFGEASIAGQSVEVVQRTPQHVTLTTTDANSGGRLRTDVQAAAGWQVTIDGASSTVDVVDGLFLGVDVPAGPHRIEFRYRPRWLAPGLAATAAGLLGVIALLALDRRRASGLATGELADDRLEPLDPPTLTAR